MSCDLAGELGVYIVTFKDMKKQIEIPPAIVDAQRMFDDLIIEGKQAFKEVDKEIKKRRRDFKNFFNVLTATRYLSWSEKAKVAYKAILRYQKVVTSLYDNIDTNRKKD